MAKNKSTKQANQDGGKISSAVAFFRNTGWLVFDKIFHMMLSLVVTSMVTRYLSQHDYGQLNYGLAFIEIFTIACKLGIDGIIVNEIVKSKEKTGEVLGTTIVLRLVSSLLSLFATGIFVAILNPGDKVLLVITLIQSVSLLFVAFDTFDYFFQSKLQSKYSALARSFSYPVICIYRLVLIFMKAKIEYFAVATILDALSIALVLYWFYKKGGAPKLKFSLDMSKYLLKHSYHFILANLLVTIYTQMDKLMLGSLANQSEVAIYTAGYTIANLWIFVPNALIDSGRPIIMRLKAEKNEADYTKRFSQLTSGIIWISIMAGIGFLLVGNIFIQLIYPEGYGKALPVLLLIVWSRLFSLLGALRSIWMLCEGYERLIKYFIGLGALINVVLNAVLIPISGAAGAALATLVTEVVSSFVATGVYKKTRGLFRIYLRGFMLRDLKGVLERFHRSK